MNYDNNNKVTDWKTYEYPEGGPSVTLTPEHFCYMKNFYYIPVPQNAISGGVTIQNEVGVNGTGYPFTEYGGQAAFYTKVVEHYGHTTIGEGKTEYTFEKDPLYGGLCYMMENPLYASYLNNCDKGVITSLLTSKKDYEYKNGEYTLVQQTTNTYTKVTKGSFIAGVDVKHDYEFQPSLNQIQLIEDVKDIFDIFYTNFHFYNIYGIRDFMVLDESTTTMCKENLSVTTKYDYDPSYRITSPVKTTRSSSVTNETETEVMTYPFNYSTAPYTQMTAANMISPVISRAKYKNVNTLLATIKNNYANKSGLFVVDNISASTGTGSLETRVQIHNHDKYGNPIHLSKDGATPFVYLWGNKGEQPVAEIKNATYDQVKAALNNTPPENLSEAIPNMTTINNLRTNTTNLNEAHVTTFTYHPLYGILSMTDPSGLRTSYEYDSLGRLSNIKDNESKLVSNYTYNFSNLTVSSSSSMPTITLSPSLSEYEQDTSTTFSASVSGGSGNYRYNWTYKNHSDSILSKSVNTTNSQFTVAFSQTGSKVLVCSVKDMVTGEIRETIQNFEVIVPRYHITVTNVLSADIGTVKVTTAKINCLYETSINILVEMETTDTQAIGSCAIGSRTLYPTIQNSIATTMTLPAGQTDITLTLNTTSLSPSSITLSLLSVNNNHSIINPAPKTIKAPRFTLWP